MISFNLKFFLNIFYVVIFIALGLNIYPKFALADFHKESEVNILAKQKRTRILVLLKDLRTENQNKDVKALQDRLKLLGFFPKNVNSTGFFGPITKKAVMNFQKSKGMKPNGFVGVLTRANLALTGFK